MCQMSVVLEKDGQQEKVMDNITTLEVTDNGVSLSTMFDQPKQMDGVRLKRIDFLDGLVILSTG